MHSKLNIDRSFLFLKGEKLTIFAERVLRSMQRNPHIKPSDAIRDELEAHTLQLKNVLLDRFLKRKDRIEELKRTEMLIQSDLDKMARHVEKTLVLKSDFITTGFRLQMEKRIPNITRRSQRMSERMDKISMPA